MSMLDIEVKNYQDKGFTIFEFGRGQISEHKNSFCGRLIEKAKTAGHKEIKVAVGARRRYRSEGFMFAVMVKG